MIKWIKRIIENIFGNRVKLIDKPTGTHIFDVKKQDFKISLRQQAHPDQDDGSGYKIIKRLKLEDMV